MREILFRGFHSDKNGKEKVYIKDEWIKGYWVEDNGIFQTDNNTTWICFVDRFIKVIPETVGQYTGLKDKNGKKIFEGDIVKYGDTVHQVVFEQRNGTAYFGLVYNKFETLPFGHYQDSKLNEVIGNIHSNPELLEV